MRRKFLNDAAAPLLALGLAASPAAAQSGADFYKGKTVTYIVSTAPGGGFDLYGRMISEYMQKHLPGSTFVVKNIPGAGHLIGANTIYASKPDGLTIGTFTTGLLYNQIVKLDGVQFDLEKMSWIGKASSDPRVMTIGAQVPIKSYKELQENKQTLNFSTSGIGSAAYVETVMLTRALKLPAKILTGYQGTDDHLAIRRGEVQASISSRSSWEAFVKNGYGRFVVQIGGNHPDVPQLASLVTDPAATALVALVQSQGDISRLTAGPPGIPQDRLDALRTAYRKAMEDPEMQAKAAKLERPLEPAYGEDVARMVKAALTQSPETIALLKQALEQPKEAAAPATKGAVAEWDGRSKIVLRLEDGKTFEAAVSGSRTEVTVAGQKSAREAIKLGMTCAIVGPGGGEAKSVDCN
ncbi:MAG TPA: tripartite tricarboxylate transporter substrate-binding protein [Xanthobacteraceae bacterium]|nr:tripartite tricarboxylate transporter substrate-binding protein [Xanthobacteraceae bacterium]